MSSPNSLGYSSSLSNGRSMASDARKRQTPSAPVYSPNETLNQMTQEAEARQQDKYNVQKEIRAIRAQEMEKQRKEDEEREKEDSSSRLSSKPTSLTKHRLHSTSRSMEEHSPTPTSSIPDPDNPRELKKKLAELEEKYTKHAIYQTQFENDNQKLLYEVDILKDLIEEHEELITELRRQFKDRSRELEYQKRTNKDLQTDFIRLKEILKQRDTLIEDSGLILYTDNELNQDGTAKIDGTVPGNEIKSVLPAALVAPETAKLLDMLGEGTIDDKLRKLLENKSELKELNTRLKSELEDERNRISSLEKKLANHASKIQDNQENAQDLHEIQRQYTKEINEFKMKNQKLDHENIVIKQDLQRLQTQLKYMQTNFDEIEQSEQRLNKEKREIQRELKDSKNLNVELQDRIERLEASQKAFEKKRQLQKINDLTSQITASNSGLSTPILSCSTNVTSAQQYIFNTSLTSSLTNDPNISPTTNDYSSSINDLNDRLNQRKKSLASSQILPNLEKSLTITASHSSTSSIAEGATQSSQMTSSSNTMNTESSTSPSLRSSNNSSTNSSPSSTPPSQKTHNDDTLSAKETNLIDTPNKNLERHVSNKIENNN